MSIGGLNLNNLTVDDNGRVSFSGLSSGIDFQGVVDSIIAAKKIPVDSLQAEVDTRKEKIAAYNDYKTLLTGLRDSLATLRGAVSFGNTNNAFQNKDVFASSSREDGFSPAAAGSLIGVTLENAASVGTHTLEVLRIAKAHKIASGTVSDKTADLGTELGLTDGSFALNGTTINVYATDSIQDVRDRINAANTGTNATGVSASVVSVSTNQHLLVLTADDAGASNEMTLGSEVGGVLASLGLSSDGGTTFDNELQVGLDARLKADGVLDPDRFESDKLSSQSALLSNYTTSAASSGNFTVTIGGVPQVIAYDTTTDSLTDLRDAINTAFGGSQASILSDGTGYRLVIDGAGSAVSVTDTDGLLSDLGVDNQQIITRSTNDITDLFSGVTLSLFAAEEGTTITLEIEQDLAAVKDQVGAFVDAYNAVRQYINQQNTVDPDTGLPSSDAGVLFGSPVLSDAKADLANLLGTGVEGVDSAFKVLAQIGIDFVDNSLQTDPSLQNTLEIDEAALNAALISNPDDVRKLFAFDFSASSSDFTLLGFTGNTAYNANGYTLNVAYEKSYDADAVTSTADYTQVDAQTGGPASDGIGAIAYSSVTSGSAFRYSYDSATEQLTLTDLTAGTSQTVTVTSAIDAVAGAGLDLGPGETADINFSTLGVTVTLSGDDGFLRGTDITTGTLDTAGLPGTTTMTNGSVTLPTSGMDKATVDALVAAGAYNPATGLLTLGITSTGSGEAHFDTATGISFAVDGGAVSADISATDLDDGSAHSIGIYVNDGSSDVLVGTVNFDALASTAAASGSVTVDLGTGLFGETATYSDSTTVMSDYLTYSDGSFEVRDASSTLLGTVNYTTGDSLDDLAASISAISGVTATTTTSGNTFTIEIKDDANGALSFTGDTGGLVTALGISNKGDAIYSANIGGSADGADDGSVTVTGNTLTATDQTGAEGLQLFYSGGADISGVTLDYTVGVAAGMYHEMETMLSSTGPVDSEIDTLSDQNDNADDRIQQILARIEIQRESLLARFIAMETTLATANRIIDSIKQTTDALFNSNN